MQYHWDFKDKSYVGGVKLFKGDKNFVFPLIMYMEKEMVVNVKHGGNVGIFISILFLKHNIKFLNVV